MQNCSQLPTILSLAIAATMLVGCQDEAATFGPEHRFTAGERPVEWEATRHARLQLSAPKKEAPTPRGFTAPTPVGWRLLPAEPSRFKDLLYQVAGDAAATCYLTASVGGGLEGNVARWYAQFGETLNVRVTTLPQYPLIGQAAHLVEVEGSFKGQPDMKLLALIAVSGDRCTTLKMTGPRSVVDVERDRFLELAKTIVPGGAVTPPAGDTSAGGAVTPPADVKAASGGVRGLSSFEDPKGWRRVEPKSSMRLLSYKIGEQTECSVIALGGDGGGLLDNLNRWRSQVDHPPLSDEEFAALAQVEVFGAAVPLLELRGNFSDGMTRRSFEDAFFLGVVALQAERAFFIKLTGPYAEAQPQRQAFVGFCSSLRR